MYGLQRRLYVRREFGYVTLEVDLGYKWYGIIMPRIIMSLSLARLIVFNNSYLLIQYGHRHH
jgi:hypothetical protein